MAWQIQTDQPLFPDLVWDQPQTRAQQPRLLIIGGRQQSLAAPLAFYQQLQPHSRLKLVVPDTWQKRLPQPPPEIVFAPSNPSGSLARRGLEQLLALAQTSDGLIIGGSIGENRETSQLVQDLISQVSQPTILVGETVRSWPAGQLPTPGQIAIPDLVGLSQIIRPWRPGHQDWNQLGRPQIMELLSQPDLRSLNLVVDLAETIWVKVLSNMCYNITKSESRLGPTPLALAGWVGLMAASYPKQLFAAATTAVYRAVQGLTE